MEHVDNLYNSLSRYFAALENVGYYDAQETKNLIIYLFIVNEIFEGELGRHLDDEGLIQLKKVLECIYQGCLINPVRDSIKIKSKNVYGNYSIRYTENLIPRLTEKEDLRIAEQPE